MKALYPPIYFSQGLSVNINKVVSGAGFDSNSNRYTYDPDTGEWIYNKNMEEPIELNPNEFTYKYPTIASDGQLIIIRDNGKIADLLSLQFRTLNTKTPKVEVVSSVRLIDGVEGLKKLRKEIDDSIDKYEKKEP